MQEMSSYIGKSVLRSEDLRFLRGEGRFVADVRLPGMLEGAVLRSPVAHGRILRIDAAKALALPGVHAVYTAADLGDVPSIPTTIIPKPELLVFFQKPLARDKVRYVGEPIAFVVAKNRYIAEDALELIEAEIEPIEAFVDARRALEPDVPLLHAASSNICDRFEARKGDTEKALREAPHRLRASFATNRHTGIPMETRGLVATADKATGLLTVWGPTKMIHRTRKVLSGLLGMPEERIRYVEPDVGGGFGFRGEFFPEDFLVPWAALRLDRPVRWIEDRQEHFMATNHSRQQWHDVEIGFDGEGRILGFRDRVMMDMGAYIRPNGLVAPTHTVSSLPGPYRHPAFELELHCVLTNKTPHGSYRGPGMYEACFVRERTIDIVAAKLGKDPADVRRVNMIGPDEMPYHVGTYEYGHEVVFDGGDYRKALEKTLAAVDYPGFRARQKEERKKDRYLGVGFASFVEPTGIGLSEYARVAVEESGKVVLFTGAASIGQGVDTTLAQVCADSLGVRFEDITVRRGDTSVIPSGDGSWGSRTAVLGGSAVHLAAQELRKKIIDVAAWRLEAPAAKISLRDGRVGIEDQPGSSLTLAQVARLVAGGQPLPKGLESGLDVSHTFSQREDTYAFGSAAALVEVDPATGAVTVLKYAIVSDVGRMINPLIVKGQLVGAMAQGVGGALLEELVFDEHGQLLTTTFMDYLVPTASELPADVEIQMLEEFRSSLNPLGVKGAGEGGIVPAAAVLSNAVADALRPLGVEITSLPLTHNRLRTLVREARRR
jgi:carbon-monoxide dehydrogenase large subunit